MLNEEILSFYKKTSVYTDLGLYKYFAMNLPDKIDDLCVLIRKQTIHPSVFNNSEIFSEKTCFWGDMTQIKQNILLREDDILPTSIGIMAELLRKNPNNSTDREAKDKVFVTCRGIALLLASILKAKEIPTRVRSGFAKYPTKEKIYLDHWITEYYDKEKNRWLLVDADCCCNDNLNFNIYDIPKKYFWSAPEVWLKYRNNSNDIKIIGHAYYKNEEKFEMVVTALFYDFHCIMNDEIIYIHIPKYLKDKHFILSEDDMKELDELAKLMLDIEGNFEKLKEIWNTNIKFRKMCGGTIH